MFHLLFICLWNFRSIPRLKMVEMMYEKLRVYYKTVRTLERLMGQITINETLETILNLRATLMQEYLSSSSLTAIIMRSQIMPPKLIEQMALWKKSSLRKSWSRPSHYHRLMRLQTWALKMGHTTLKQSVIRFLESTLKKKYEQRKILVTFVIWKTMSQTILDGLLSWKFAFMNRNKF